MHVTEHPLIILDIDGVLTSTLETPGSFKNHKGDDYGVSRGPYRHLLELISSTDAKVVISSNWRRFEEIGPLSYWHNMSYGDFKNPLPNLKKHLKSCYLCDLPKDRHIRKSEALRRWFADTGINPEICSYVIFDDDEREGFVDSEFKVHFIMTDFKTGLTSEDCKKAEMILQNSDTIK